MSQTPSPEGERPDLKSGAQSVLTAQLLLLLRLALSDVTLGRRETDALGRIAAVLGIVGEDAGKLLSSLDRFVTDKEIAVARLSLREESHGHARILARLLFDAVARDAELAPRGERLAIRVGDILGLGAQDMEELAFWSLQR